MILELLLAAFKYPAGDRVLPLESEQGPRSPQPPSVPLAACTPIPQSPSPPCCNKRRTQNVTCEAGPFLPASRPGRPACTWNNLRSTAACTSCSRRPARKRLLGAEEIVPGLSQAPCMLRVFSVSFYIMACCSGPHFGGCFDCSYAQIPRVSCKIAATWG